MTSTKIPSNDPFALESIEGATSGWRSMPTASEPGRLVCSNDPFETPPMIPDGYEPILEDPHGQYCEDDRAIRPIVTGPIAELVLPPLIDDHDASTGLDEPLVPRPASEDASTRPKPTQRPKRKAARPTTGVETRKPTDQNDYTMCAVNSKQLGGNALTVVLIAAVEFGLSAFKQDRRFCAVERELTAGYVSEKMLKSRPVAIAALSEAVKLGFLERTDNGKGGRGNTNKAKYRPVLPAYMLAPDRQV